MSVTNDEILDEMIELLAEAAKAAGKKVKIGSTRLLFPGNAIIKSADHGNELWIRKAKSRASKDDI